MKHIYLILTVLVVFPSCTPEYKVGEKYFICSPDPFSPPHLVVITDVRDGWVQYQERHSEADTNSMKFMRRAYQFASLVDDCK